MGLCYLKTNCAGLAPDSLSTAGMSSSGGEFPYPPSVDETDTDSSAGSPPPGGALIVSGLNLLVNHFGSRSTACPPTYPHLIKSGLPSSKYQLCYKQNSDAIAGSGPCGSWCANPTEWPIVKNLWGSTCGSLCQALPPPPSKNSTGVPVPEAAWLLHRLLEYGYTSPQPRKTLALKVTECPGCMPSSFTALCGAN